VIRVGIDRDKCVGSGNCVFWAPATFDLGDDGISVVIDPSGDTEERIRVAVDGCPSKAIWMESADQSHESQSPAEAEAESANESEAEAEFENEGEGGHGDRLVR